MLPLLLVSIAFPTEDFSDPGWKSITIPIADSSEHHIHLPWLINNSISVRIDTVILYESQDFFWIDSTRSLIVTTNQQWMNGKSILINYRSAAIVDSLTFQLYKPTLMFDSSDAKSHKSYYKTTVSNSQEISPFGDWGGIYRYGSLSRGIRIRGSDATLSSGLHLQMSGRLAKGAIIDALIDDRDISATKSEGSSTFSELDKIYFNYSSPALTAELGDIDIHWDVGKFGHFSRQIKGGSLAVRNKKAELSLVAAGSDNTYHRITLSGRSGDQGPYELVSTQGLPGIQVNTGSEVVYLNSRRLKRGFEGDYLIDYARGSITFMPKMLINSDSRIEVEYQYTDGDYAAFLFAGRASSSVLNKSLSIQVATLIEGDDEDQPLLYEWTDEMKQSVSAAGDRPSLAVISGIDSVGVGKGDYYYEMDGSLKWLVFSLPDSLGHPTGYLSVIFSPDKFGEYIRVYNAGVQAFYFEWVGAGTGDNRWSPTRPIPLPERLIHHDVVMSHSIASFSSQSEIAISNHDLNTLSDHDESDNSGVAWRWLGSWGNQDSHSLFTTLTIQNRENNYRSADRSVQPDFNYHWNLPDSAASSERSIETALHLKPTDKFSTRGEAGFLAQGGNYEVKRLGISSNYAWQQWTLSGSHHRIERSNLQVSSLSRLLKWNGEISREFASTSTSYNFDRDDLIDRNESAVRSGTQRDNHAIRVKHRLNSLNEIQLFTEYFDEDRVTDSHSSNWSDTRSIAGSWRRARNSSGGWSAAIRRSFTTYSGLPATFATNARFDAIKTFSQFPLTLQTNYFLTTGNNRISTTVASFVGDNQGGYRRENDRYVPDPNGEFDLHNVLTDTIAVVSRVDFSGRITFGEKASGFREENHQEFWFGFKGSTIRIEAELMTSANDSWEAFLLTRGAFNAKEVISSRLIILQDYDFISNNRHNDSRLSLVWEEDLDRIRYGGERNRTESVSFRQRTLLNPILRIEILPSLTHSTREKLIINEKKSDIYSIGSQVEGVVQPPDSPLDVGLSFIYTSKKDRISKQAAIVREWKPRVTFRFPNSGSGRIDGSWIVLSSTGGTAWYDLDRGWKAGDNFKVNLSYVSQIYDNVSINFYYRGLWIGGNIPRHEGLLEFTATL